MTCARFVLQCAVSAAAFTAIAGTAAAQSAANGGQIVGRVTDSSGAALQTATVTIRNIETNYSREVQVDDTGRYAATALPLGPYEVTARQDGFDPGIQHVEVTLGSSMTVNLALKVGSVQANVQVVAAGAELESTRSAAKSVLAELQIAQLPTNGRRMQNLTVLTPTSQVEPECRGLSVLGQKGLYTNVSVDGGDYNSVFACGIRGRSESAPTFSLEAVQELHIVRNGFSAEFGRSTGGLINMSTKSGTNAHRGSGFWYMRHKDLAQPDAFDRETLVRNHQFGGSIGGPVRRDRTFFFSALEFQQASKPVQVHYAALDAQNVRSTPGAQALLAVAPEEEIEAISDSRSFINRLDHRINDTHQLMIRVDHTKTQANNNPGATALSTGPSIESITTRARTNQAVLTDRSETVLTQLTSVLSQRALNEVRVQVAQEFRPRSTVGSGPEVTVRNKGATIAVYGPQASGLGFGNLGFESSDRKYQVVENLTFVTGSHTTKFGADFTHIDADILFAPGVNAMYDFASLDDFLARRPRLYQQFTGTGSLDFAMTYVAAYAQDEWRVTPGLTISPGFRYEAQFNPDYANPTRPENRPPMATHIPDHTTMFAPRLGLAWDVTRDGSTIVRAGAGLYYAPTMMSLFAQSLLFNGGNPELGSRVVFDGALLGPASPDEEFQPPDVGLPTANLAALPVLTRDQLAPYYEFALRYFQRANIMAPDFENPRGTQLKIGVERRLASRVTAGIEFTSVNTTHVERQRDLNLGEPTTDATGRRIYGGPRPFSPKFSVVQVTESAGRATYRGLTLSLNVRRPSFTWDAYYTLSYNRSHDDSERGFSSVRYDDVQNLENEFNWSNLDQRHQFTSNAVVFLPWNVQFATTTAFISGRPYSARVGVDLNRDRWLNDRPIVDGQVLRRNTFRNSSFADVSIKLQRSFPLASGNLAVFAQAFNAFGFDNVFLGSANMIYGPGTVVLNNVRVGNGPIRNGVVTSVPPPPTFGRLRDDKGRYLRNNIAGDPFQVQVGVHYRF